MPTSDRFRLQSLVASIAVSMKLPDACQMTYHIPCGHQSACAGSHKTPQILRAKVPLRTIPSQATQQARHFSSGLQKHTCTAQTLHINSPVMQNYPPPGGNQGYNQGYDQNQGQGGFNQGQGGYNQGQGGYNQGYNQSSGYGHQPQGGSQGYDQWNPNSAGQNSFGGGSSGYGAPNVYPQQGGGFNSNSQAPSGYPQQQGSFGQQGDPSQWNAQTVPQEHLPPGYNPNTRAPYQPHELPPGAQMAGPGEEGEPKPSEI